ncbi:MAG: tRNA(His) guanylyltransferase Thg1 family protein [Sodaliphilus sp.]
MDFDTLNEQMRRFEQSLDRTMLEGIYIVARLDGHGFTRLTKKEWDLEKPFDIKFRDAMIATTEHLMECGFRIVYGYTQSDEISLLFHIDESAFSRKERKLISILAAEASVAFSTAMGKAAVFDCRLVPLPREENVVDYFRWRQEDAHRNSLNSHCYWALRKNGVSAANAQKQLSGISNSKKNEILFERGINYNNLPTWQKRGVGIYFRNEQREGYNPIANKTTLCTRRVLYIDTDLPIGQAYSTYIARLITDSQPT